MVGGLELMEFNTLIKKIKHFIGNNWHIKAYGVTLIQQLIHGFER